MVTRIQIQDPPANSNPIRGLQGLDSLDAQSARSLLRQIETQVAGKGGVLKLMHTSKDQDMVFERKSWYQGIARRQNKMDQTAAALKTLYVKAGMSPVAIKQLDNYLQEHSNRVGGGSLARLLQGHLEPRQSQNLVQRLLPRETNANPVLRSDVFGSEISRRTGTAYADPGLNAAERAQSVRDRDQRNLQMCRDYPDINPNYLIGTGPNDPARLTGISRSATPSLAQQLDTSKPIVIFLGGSHGNVADYGYPAAHAAGSNASGGLNFLAVDYRGYGASGDANPTPKTVTDDAMRVYQHVRDLGFTPDKIILRGYSMGAAAAARIHAACDLRGEKLMGVIYDRPMASASAVAKQMEGSAAGWATKQSVGDFGADRYLALIHRLGSGDMSNTVVIKDKEDRLGPPAEAMARNRGIELKSPNIDHEAHLLANDAVSECINRFTGHPN